VTRPALLLLLALMSVACGSGGSTPASSNSAGLPSGGSPSAAAPSSTAASAASAASQQPIANHGPVGWVRGPYDLAGGNYRIDWETDGSCTALYFGLVGVTNGYRETPSTVGDVALKDLGKGSRTIANVPAGSYYFNVSNQACKKYSATLTPVP
jgi:hypothetical protein